MTAAVKSQIVYHTTGHIADFTFIHVGAGCKQSLPNLLPEHNKYICRSGPIFPYQIMKSRTSPMSQLRATFQPHSSYSRTSVEPQSDVRQITDRHLLRLFGSNIDLPCPQGQEGPVGWEKNESSNHISSSGSVWESSDLIFNSWGSF